VKRFSDILLIAVEGTDYSAALKRAVTLARNNQAHLTICAVVDSVPGDMQMALTAVTPAELRNIAVTEKRDWPDELVKSVATDGAPLEARVLIGKPFIEIIRQVLEMSSSLALSESSELHIVHAWCFAGEDLFRSARTGFSDAEVDAMVDEEASARRRWLENLVKTYGSKADKNAIDILEPQLHLIQGRARQVVPAKANELAADLVVMGTVARTGIAGFFMGNTAENILTQLDCSVLTIKPPGFISPVTLEA